MNTVFQRYEYKYLLDDNQYNLVLRTLAQRDVVEDDYGKTTICNLYFDTPDYALIRRSLAKPVYKEKLRIRTYGTATSDCSVFVEIKKKYDGIVYKRRIVTDFASAENFCRGKPLVAVGQICNEINYFANFYPDLLPRMYLSYDRCAYFGSGGLRITFDDHILWRNYDLDLRKKPYGDEILQQGQHLMEVKVCGAMPLWLAKFLSANGIFRTGFSKYGRAYLAVASPCVQTQGVAVAATSAVCVNTDFQTGGYYE